MKSMKMGFVPDEPISSDHEDIDLLSFRSFVTLIQDAIRATKTPFVYGVLGDWGTGKTSVLKMLETRLNAILAGESLPLNETICVPIWFNAWKYENEANLVYPLLKAIELDYKKRVPEPSDGQTSTGNRLRKFAGCFVRAASATVLASSDVLLRMFSNHFIGDTVRLEDVEKLVEILKKETIGDEPVPRVWHQVETTLGAWTDGVAMLDTTFRDLLGAYAEELAHLLKVAPASLRFVIMVDDLDRCLPDTVIKILENIKNYLSVDRCIFILGLNAQVVYQGISHKYHGVPVDGREYLEKILNYTFYMPEPEIALIRQFASARITALVDNDVLKKFKEEIDIFGNVLEDCKFNNPRKIKRILNRYLMFLAKYEAELKDFFMPDIVRLITIAEYFPSLFQLFIHDANQAEKARANCGFGKATFVVSEFEKLFGINIQGIFSQLSRLSGLFKLEKSGDDLVAHAQAVYSITRLI